MPVEIRVPAMGESVVEATIAEWLKNPGDKVQPGEDLVELETDKVNQAIQSEVAGVLAEVRFKAGDTVAVGDVLAIVSENGAAPAVSAPVSGASATAAPADSYEKDYQAPTAPTTTEKPNDPAPAASGDVAATPVAQEMARQNNVDLSTVKGTRPDGKIGKDDVANQIERAASQPSTAIAKQQEKASPAAASVRPATSTSGGRPEERIPMSRRRSVIAQNLKDAQNTAAMLTTFNEVDMSAVMEVRKRRKEAFEKRFGVGLGFMSFFTKAVVGALKQFPYVNAEIQGNEIVLKKYYDIGIAVGIAEGLVVPVVRDADKLSFAEIEKKIKELAGKAQEGKLALSDLQGGTFTITNGGIYGSLMSTPILNYPQVGILGMHTIKERAVVMDGQIVARPMMYIALSYDHRLIDGSTAVRFLVKVKELVEDPETLLLEG
jgi:2-oxoglutarate dehydrogenase E2 component (dihydrolipoamide succinyltransferase)